MRRRRGKFTWRENQQRCPHCGRRGLMAKYRGRRLYLERCPDCGAEWPHTIKAVPATR